MMEGVVSYLGPNYGFIVSKDNFLHDDVLFTFGSWSYLGEIKISELGALDEFFQVGMNVLFDKPFAGDTPSSTIFKIKYLQPVDYETNSSLTQMVTISTGVRNTNVAVAMTSKGQLVCVHPHLFTNPVVDKTILSNSRQVMSQGDKESQLKEFHKVVIPGRTLEGRVSAAPQWMKNQFLAFGVSITFLALSAENLSITYNGYAKFVRASNSSILLRSIDEPAQDVIYPLALVPKNKHKDYMNIPSEQILFYYTACKNLSGSSYPLRAYKLQVVDGGQHIIEQMTANQSEPDEPVPSLSLIDDSLELDQEPTGDPEYTPDEEEDLIQF
ncbi:unnamed protein product [Bursaphelenchus okinawaensis]|uniref:Uncharacterized protein n=1 Tax=Bursaphelenchus okinawaensis TaxID=465554 RepID=A0A811L756_9BILA|nr:unnamed protein product [Bursaphelenchus okinawaensis]CAG9119687.1 unnamed protein product [Bursaphelenchus okinawaensis]